MDARFRYSPFSDVLRYGPSMADRVAGSGSLRRWQTMTRLLCRGLGRVELAGVRQLPAHGPVIVAMNHTSAMDGALLFGLLDRPVSFLVKAEAFQPLHGLAGRVLIRNAQLPVRRQLLDPAPVRWSLRLLEFGGVLGICPEGHRGDGLVSQARPGVGYFALKSGAPVLPVAVHGAPDMVPGPGWRRPPVRIVCGAPIRLAAAGPGPLNRRRWLAATEQIRGELADLVRASKA
jgi:1-acyl-sn-glycerol-3-phosphate acyltransferase